MLNRLQSEYVDQDAATEDELRQIVSGAPAPTPAPTTFTSNTFTPTPTTYTASSAQTLAPTPEKIALFGDSISSAVGYGADSNIDTKYGNTVADVLSGYFGTSVDSQAIGGLTTQDVLSGKALPGGKSYEDYLKEQNPSFAILRYGAADAIKLNDPAKTIANLQSMIDLAKQYGSQPVLVGVSPFASGNDIRAGNINEWSVDPYINSAEIINAGIKQLAEKNNLQFVDVRSLDAPKGSLLDGVHPTADFGKQMADYIGQSVASAFPQFSNVSLTPTPKPTGWLGTGGIGGDASSLPATTPKPFDVTKADWSQGVQNIGGTIYQPIFQEEGAGETYQRGPLQQVLRYQSGQTAPGQTYEIIDPTTGQVTGTGQFKKVGNLGDMLQSVAIDLAPLILTAVGIPGSGLAASIGASAASTLGISGLSAASTAALGSAVTNAALTAAQGGSFQDVLTAAAASGLGNVAAEKIAAFAQTAGSQIGTLAGSDALGQAVTSGITAGTRALPQAIATGNFGNVLTSALTAGATSGITAGLSDLTGFTQPQVNAAINIAQGAASGDLSKVLAGASAFTDSQIPGLASKAVNLVSAIESGNPGRIASAMQGFGSEMDAYKTRQAAFSSTTDTGDEAARLAARYGTADQAADRAATETLNQALVYQGANDADTVNTAARLARDAGYSRFTWGGIEYALPSSTVTGQEVDQAIINDVLRQSPTKQVARVGTEDVDRALSEDVRRMSVYDATAASSLEEAGRQAQAAGYTTFRYGGGEYTVGTALPTATQTRTTTGTTGTTAAVDTSGLPAFRNAFITTLPQSRAAEIIAEMYPGQSLDWVNQAVLNAAASHIRADDEAGLRARLAAGQPLGTGDAISGDRAVDYRAPAGTRVAQPGENAGLLGYTETGTPVNLIQQLGTTARKMTPEEAFAYDMANAGEAIDPETGRPYELDTSENARAIAEVIRGVPSALAAGAGEQIKLLGVAGGWLTGNKENALTQVGSNWESWANSITPDSVKKGQDAISKQISDAKGLPSKAWAAVTGAATNPLALIHWIGKEAIQEVLPLGSAITVGRAVNTATKLKYGEDLAQRFGLTAAIGTDATMNAGESATASYQEVYNNLRNKGVSVEKASSAAAAAAAGSGLITLFTAAIGDAALVNKLMNNVKGATLNATLKEGPTEFAEGTLQSVAEQNATNLALGKGLIFDPNEALTSGTLEWLIGTGTTGTIAKGADIFTTTSAAATAATAPTDTSSASTAATAPTTAASTANVVVGTDPTSGAAVTLSDLGLSTPKTADATTPATTATAGAAATGATAQNAATVVSVDPNANTALVVNANGDASVVNTDGTAKPGDTINLGSTAGPKTTDASTALATGANGSVLTGADLGLGSAASTAPATATATGPAATTAGTTATTTGAAPTAKQNTATVVSVDPTDNTALVVDNAGNTSVVNTDSTAKAGDTINLGGDTTGTAATGATGASTATTSGGTASTAPKTTVQGTTAPTGTSVTANTGNVVSVDPTDNTALVVDSNGNTSVVNTDSTAKAGDTINLGGTSTTATSNVAAQTGASTTGTSNTATVLSVDPNAGTALVKDSSGSVSVVNADAKTTVGDVVSLPTTKPVTTSVAVPALPAEIALDPNKTSISQLNQYIDQSLASGKSFDQVADAMKSAGYSDAYIQQKRQDAKDGTAADDDYVQLLKQIEAQKQGAEQASMEQSRQQAATIAAQKQATQKSFESALQQGLALPSNFDSLNQPEQVQWFNMRGLTPSDLKSMGIVGDEAGLSVAELRNAGYSVVDPGLSAARKNELQKLDAIFKEDDPIGIANVANLYNITPNEIQNVFGYSDRQLRQLQNAGYAVQAAPVASVSPEQTSGTPTTGAVLSVDPTDNTALVVDPNGEIQVVNVAPGTQPNSQVALEVAPTTPAQTAPEVVADVKPEVKPETKPEVVQQVAQETPADTALEADVLPPVTEQELASIVAGPVETAPEIVPEPASKPVTEVAPEVTPEVVPEVAQETVTDVVPEVKPEVKPEVVTEPTVTPEAKPDVEATTVKPEVSPEQTPVSPETSPKVPVTPEPPSVAEDVLPPVTEDELRDIVAGTPSEPPAPPPPVTPPPVAPPPVTPPPVAPPSQPPAVQPPAQPPVVYPPEVAQFAKSLGIPQEMAAQMLQESSEADLLTMFAELFEEREQKRKERGAQSKSRKA